MQNRPMCRPVSAEIRVHIPYFSKVILSHNRAGRQSSATTGCYNAVSAFQNVTTYMHGDESRNKPKMPLALAVVVAVVVVVVVWLRQCLRGLPRREDENCAAPFPNICIKS